MASEVYFDKTSCDKVCLNVVTAITTATKPQLKGKNKVVCFVFMNVIFFLLLFFDILYVSILLIKTFQLLWFCHIVDNRPLTFAHSQLYSKIICFIVFIRVISLMFLENQKKGQRI
jgi:hypothetical protein